MPSLYPFNLPSIPLLSLHIFLLLFLPWDAHSHEACSPQPSCWSRDITCSKWQLECNGSLCTRVCHELNQTAYTSLIQKLDYQRFLQSDLPLPQVQFLGAHNALISLPYGVGWEEEQSERLLKASGYKKSEVVIANQRLSLQDLLTLGIRHLELDLHSVRLEGSEGVNGLRICHWPVIPPGFVRIVEAADRRNRSSSLTDLKLDWDPRRLACNKELLSLQSILQQIHEWLEQHPSEFLRLYLDNRIPPCHAHLLFQLLHEQFPPHRLLTPRVLRERFNDRWPSVKELTQAGLQLMIEHYESLWDWQRYVPEAREMFWPRERLWQEFRRPAFEMYPACRLRRSGDRETTVVTRALDESLVLGPIPGFDSRLQGFVGGAADIRQLMECNVHIISMDQITPRLLEDTLWSWSSTETPPFSKCTLLRLSDGRWIQGDCETSWPFLCHRQTSEGVQEEWLVIQEQSTHANRRCPLGSRLGVPRNAHENRMVQQQAQEHEMLWIEAPSLNEDPLTFEGSFEFNNV